MSSKWPPPSPPLRYYRTDRTDRTDRTCTAVVTLSYHVVRGLVLLPRASPCRRVGAVGAVGLGDRSIVIVGCSLYTVLQTRR